MTKGLLQQLIQEERYCHYKQSLFLMENWSRVGSELLLRSELGAPDVLFERAKTENQLYELDTSSIHKAIQTYILQEYTRTELLFINIFPSTIIHHDFLTFIKETLLPVVKAGLKIVLELNEAEKIERFPLLKERVSYLKQIGCLIAIDDIGKGWATLSTIVELQPHFLKLDRYFSINLTTSRPKQEMIKAVLQFTQYAKSKVVLEGIEEQTDLAMAKSLGVDICQGYLLERPHPIGRALRARRGQGKTVNFD